MKYIEWRDELEHFLGELDESERENIILYYGEMYADKRDSGLSEEDAVAQFGAPYDAAKKILDGEEYPKEGAKRPAPEESDQRALFTSCGAADAIEINGALSRIHVKFSRDRQVRIDYPVNSLLDYRISQQGGKITIKHRNIKFKNVDLKAGLIAEMTIELPADMTPHCDIRLTGGSIKLAGGDYGNIKAYIEGGALSTGKIFCGDAHFATDAGKIDISGAVCHRLYAEVNAGVLYAGSICGSCADIKINAGKGGADMIDCKRTNIFVSAGAANIKLAGRSDDYDIKVKKTLSSCSLEERSAGSERSLAAEVYCGALNAAFEG